MTTHRPPLQYRSVFISDCHLGTRGCQSGLLSDFLSRLHCRQLYLVGDIVDCWRLRKSWFWDETHDDVLRLILRHAADGTAVTYIPGNHDEMLRNWLPFNLHVAGVTLAEEAVHITADGRQLLVLHGDKFDSVVRYAKFLALLGDQAYTFALVLNRLFNNLRRRFNYPYWSLSAWMKRQVKQAVMAIDRYEDAVVREARHKGVDGVVCGHIHHAELRTIDGVLYANTGDWVESCTALVEHMDGRLELIDWAAMNALSMAATPTPRRPVPVPA